jgi:TatA/E family protein of Tat protein translocase
MFGLTPAHLIIILVIALIVVGPGKLPEVGSAIGKSIREFQKAVGPVQDARILWPSPRRRPKRPSSTCRSTRRRSPRPPCSTSRRSASSSLLPRSRHPSSPSRSSTPSRTQA